MAFARANLNLSSSGAADAPKIWTYKSADAIATLNTEGYFNSARRELNVGDLIYAYDTATPTASLVIVLSNASKVVDVSDGTAISVADAD